jgi:hypothetical protein
MDDLQAQLGAILGNPDMMSQIMAMAQQLGNGISDSSASPPPAPAESPLADLDMGAIAKVAGLASQTGIDRNQKALLGALHPYLSQERIRRLEKAMRAAKIAGIASSVLGSTGLLSI